MNLLKISQSSVTIQLLPTMATTGLDLLQGSKSIPSSVSINSSTEEITVDIKIQDFSIYEDLKVSSEMGDYSLSSVFDKYRLDTNKLADEFYVTEKIINAGTRGMGNQELFFVAYNAFSVMPARNHFYGSLITLIAYKYLEAPEERTWVLSRLIEAKKKYDESIEVKTPNIVRWGISSTTALSLALLLNDFVDDAERIIDKTISVFEPHHNQLSYWNYCQCLILKSAILVYKQNQGEAGWKFLSAFDFSRRAINDIYHSRNNWVLGQISDCQALLSLGELALKCGAKCLGNKIPSESRFADIKHHGGVSFAPVFIRFRDSRAKFKSSFFDSIEKNFNS